MRERARGRLGGSGGALCVLVGVVAAALTGCVSVAPGPGPVRPPATSAESPRKPEPLVVEGRPREALESATPASAPASRPTPTRERADVPREKGAEAPPRARATVRPPRPAPARVPVAVRTAGAVPDVCGLVERHGAWRLGGAGSRTCREATRR
ncbi:hypothetical protein LUW75_21925 [Streptomyces sp. MRC013]|uniref:hypothetical protein n=1 Tax=Streptomyces sp. MRC013 TaxID=2898276 RepID=UPI002025D87C|nr:hypothetical protein [Streptomyces sp. MRC013]URM92172.1 hypothetical protein LUW75_21925 [Streptomyces sp. MRC013]